MVSVRMVDFAIVKQHASLVVPLLDVVLVAIAPMEYAKRTCRRQHQAVQSVKSAPMADVLPTSRLTFKPVARECAVMAFAGTCALLATPRAANDATPA